MAKFIPKPKPGSAISPLPRPSSYFKGGAGGLIPGETASGQTMLFQGSMFKKPTPRPMSEAHLKRKVMQGIKQDATKKPPFAPSGKVSGAARDKVKGVARREELARKKNKKKLPKPGQVVPYDAPKRYGPNTKSEQRVDDLFGV